MSKALILGAAADALGDDWAAKHNGLKKTDLVTAAAAAFRPDPARDADIEAAATRWLPPGFAPNPVDEGDAPELATESEVLAGNAEPGEAADNGDDPAEVRAGSGQPAEDVPSAADADDASGTDPAGNGAAPTAGDDGALPAFLNS